MAVVKTLVGLADPERDRLLQRLARMLAALLRRRDTEG